MIIATDFSNEMIKTARKNLKNYPDRKVKNELFDLVSARHTRIDAKKIYDILKPNGVLVVEGVDKNDCIDLKDCFWKRSSI